MKFPVFIDLTGNTSQVVPHKGAYNFITILTKKKLVSKKRGVSKNSRYIGKRSSPHTRKKCRNSLHKTTLNTVFFCTVLAHIRVEYGRIQNIIFLYIFLSNFPVYHCITAVWINVTRISFYSVGMNLREYGKLYQYGHI